MNDKLKEIRDKWFIEWGLNPNVRPDSMFPLTAEDVNTIQSETYQLGRSEVIEEALKIFDDIPYHDVPVLIDQYGGVNIETRIDIQKLKSKLKKGITL